MSQKIRVLHTARLNNNCPECFSTDGLEITFTQDEKETLFFKKPAKQVVENLYCHTCKNPIYPVSWTEDIERVYDYNKKIAETHKQYLKVKPLFYILILLGAALCAFGVYFLIANYS